MTDRVQQLIDEILAIKRQAEQEWEAPTLPEDEPRRDYSLQIRRGGSPEPLPPALSLDEIRVEMRERIDRYLTGRSTVPLLINVPAGVGKTHIGVEVAQQAAREGKRTFWFAARRATFDEDIAAFPHFAPRLWYYWRAIQEDDGEPVCRFAGSQARWTQAGYRSSDLCNALCKADGHSAVCPYIAQRGRDEQIVFVRHNHLAVGVPMPKFQLAIIDELPLAAFVEERAIPLDRLTVSGAASTVNDLVDAIQLTGYRARGKRVSGNALFAEIGPLIEDVLAHLEVRSEENVYPKPPVVRGVGDLQEIPYWWFQDFMRVATPEYVDWSRGKPAWAERVWLGEEKLHILSRKKVWADIPGKKIIFDATGDADIYRQIFGASPEVYRPRVRRAGRIYQITMRNNGKQSLKDPRRSGDIVDIVRRIVQRYGYANVGIICHKALEEKFSAAGFEQVRHYGALRGTNELERCDALFCCGSPGADMASVHKIALALDDKRRSPLSDEYRQVEIAYTLTETGLAQLRADHGDDATGALRLSGIYADPALETVARQAKRAELEQAIHRSRVNKNPGTTVWILSATPTTEAIDWLIDRPPLAPDGIDWRLWERICAYLDTQSGVVGYSELSEAAGISERWAKEKRLLDIVAANIDGWRCTQIERSGPGRPRAGLCKLQDNILE